MPNTSDRSRHTDAAKGFESNTSATPPIAEPTPQGVEAVNPAVELGRRGGAARARSLTSERRSEIARMAAARRWSKKATKE